MKQLKSVFDFESLDEYEKTILTPSVQRMIIRDSGDVPIPHSEVIKALTKEEYFEDTDQSRRYRDISTIFMIRGDFEKAYQYEILSQVDFVEMFEAVPRDLLITNEQKYYEWRKKNP